MTSYLKFLLIGITISTIHLKPLGTIYFTQSFLITDRVSQKIKLCPVSKQLKDTLRKSFSKTVSLHNEGLSEEERERQCKIDGVYLSCNLASIPQLGLLFNVINATCNKVEKFNFLLGFLFPRKRFVNETIIRFRAIEINCPVLAIQLL